MASAPDHATDVGGEAVNVGQALLDATDAIAEMAHRVQLNGPEPVYASEKLGHALYKAAKGSRCATSSLRRSPRRRIAAIGTGAVSKRRSDERRTARRQLHHPPGVKRGGGLRVTATNGSVIVLVRHAEATAGVRLTVLEARVRANVLNATASRVEAER